MKKILKVLFYVSIGAFMLSGAFFTIFEFMPDVSVIDKTVRSTICIVGLLCLSYAIIYYLMQNRKGNVKPKTRR